MTPPVEPQALEQFAGRLDDLRDRLVSNASETLAVLIETRQAVEALRAEAEGWGCDGLATALRRLGLLTEVWECLEAEEPLSAAEVGAFCEWVLAQLAQGLRAGDGEVDTAWIVQESSARWGGYLGLLAPAGAEDQESNDPQLTLAEEARSDDDPAAIDVDSLLRLLTSNHTTTSEPESDPSPLKPDPRVSETVDGQVVASDADQTALDGAARSEAASFCDEQVDGIDRPGFGLTELDLSANQSTSTPPSRIPPPNRLLTPFLDLEPELREAFLADATDLFERIQTLVLDDLGKAGSHAKTVRELGRCFHTLKGAAGSVGLSDMATRIHNLEDRLGEAASDAGAVPVDLLHEMLGYLESVLEDLQKCIRMSSAADDVDTRLRPVVFVDSAPPTNLLRPEMETDTFLMGSTSTSQSSDGSIRVSCERIDELMDLVSELITRRGLGAAQAEAMKEFAATARLGRNRLMASIDRIRDLTLNRDAQAASSRAVDATVLGRRLAEQSEDLAALAETARAAADPLVDDADALARISLRLWDALQAIRVVPVRGLFHRLARVAREAARIEGRPIEVILIGEDAGLDRSVQEKAFEPLLHAVRNAVGHGIEPVQERISAGKHPLGRVTLEARREGYTMVLKVHDDGRGLDYVAIKERGQQLGLLQPDEEPTPERLNDIVFQPGFSTREHANSVAGRGVGMDVIAQEVGRLHGTVALDSEPGAGTMLTIRLPSRLALEQAMVVRIDGQPFALPLTSIELAQQFTPGDQDSPAAAATVRLRDRRVRLLDARRALGLAAASPLSRPKLLLIRAEGESVALLVDAIDGPRELVIKPLGALLAGHPLIAGTSLSPAGELVLVLDPFGLIRYQLDDVRPTAHEPIQPPPAKVLVVDDAISVRRAARRHLRALGFESEEAVDGVEALHKVRSGKYRLVLVDLEIPRMDGFELLAELGRSGMSAVTPVVVISTRSDPHTLRRVLDLGARALIAKPIGQNDLAGTIAPLLHPAALPEPLEHLAAVAPVA